MYSLSNEKEKKHPDKYEWSIRCKIRTYETSIQNLNVGELSSSFSTRAVYLERVEGYDTNSFIRSLPKSFSGRGKLGDIYSDCGINLKETNYK